MKASIDLIVVLLLTTASCGDSVDPSRPSPLFHQTSGEAISMGGLEQ